MQPLKAFRGVTISRVWPGYMSNVVLDTLAWLVNALLSLCWFLVIAAVVVSWLVAFGVLNMSNQTVRQIVRALDAITEPIFRPIRKIIPPIGGLDLSPIFVLLAIAFLQFFFGRLFDYLRFGV
jgi:YggT family protein